MFSLDPFSVSNVPIKALHRAENCTVQMPHPRENYQITALTFSVASIMLLKLCMLTWFIRQHIKVQDDHRS